MPRRHPRILTLTASAPSRVSDSRVSERSCISGSAPMADSDIAEIALIHPGDILFLYTDGIYDGTDEEERRAPEALMRAVRRLPAKAICNAVLERAVRRDEALRDRADADLIDDKTVFIIKCSGCEDASVD